ncbi:MAG: hypothetical protein ACJ8FY_13475 [Gemmataceae bacterium]
MKLTVLVAIVGSITVAAPHPLGQAKKDKTAKVISISAEDLTRECMADKGKGDRQARRKNAPRQRPGRRYL